MTIAEVETRQEPLIQELVRVWERSIRATHLFLTGEQVEKIRRYVPQALEEVSHLVVAQDGDKGLVAFMGVEEHKLEMLFLDPERRGKGLGRRLLQYGIDHYGVRELTVNEQNPQARGFYGHMGFQVFRRTELDEQGAPYPLLYLRRED